MDKNLFNFENKKERNDFYIALVVIGFFGWLFFHFTYCENKMALESETLAEASIGSIIMADFDRDGIADEEDNCPRLAGIAANDGCPADTDGDGIYDENDACPEVAGTESNKGCPDAVDSDGDGFPDKKDKCPELAGEDHGCPPDTDGDGIANAEDKCPRKAGLAENNGCPPDADGDRVFDEDDKCPKIAGVAENNGCPADTDKDGIYDKDDKCPDLAGVKNNKGCPADSDRDGVYDKEDKCPRKAGTKANNGCPEVKDADGDGIPDSADKCPNKAGNRANNGCPEVKMEAADKKIIDAAIKSVAFLPSSPNLTVYSQGLLKQVSAILNKYPDYKLKISGHTDSTGSDESNLTLSKNRAKSCMDFLVKNGIDATRLSSDGYGESKPVADNNTKAGRLKNRRVEFELHY